MIDQTNKIASKYLGKRSEGSTSYAPSLLVAIPRELNRSQYNLQKGNLPFIGDDIWHAYEFSCMTENGLPVTRVIKLKLSCLNDFIIESKSLKLYFNSFNMSRFGKSVAECLDICKKLIEKDLSQILQTNVNIQFLENITHRTEIFSQYIDIITLVQEQDIVIEHFTESPQLLQTESSNDIKSHYLSYDALRSNCRVTHQPDFGDVYIYYKSYLHIKEASIIQYLASFRSEYHFHEECCEMIFKRLSDILNPNDELMVCTLYTRRGGIDICPIRYSPNLINQDILKLANTSIFARNGIKQ